MGVKIKMTGLSCAVAKSTVNIHYTQLISLRGAGWGEGLQLWSLDLEVNHQPSMRMVAEAVGWRRHGEERVPEEKPAPDRALGSSRLSWWVGKAMAS